VPEEPKNDLHVQNNLIEELIKENQVLVVMLVKFFFFAYMLVNVDVDGPGSFVQWLSKKN
jgi:hypothetical protein